MLGVFRRSQSAVFLVMVLWAPTAFSTVVTEEPWHPAAAAYRTMLFMANLVPAPWDEIRRAYEEPHPAAAVQRPASTYFDGLPADMNVAIVDAIASENRQALYEASTRAVSWLARAALAETAAALADPGRAQQKALEAQAYYRAFASFIEEADREAARRLGFA